MFIILDGFGYSKNKMFNAAKNSHTPFLSKKNKEYTHSLLYASGKNVGLPKGQVGNSEVGHTTMSSGKIVNQYLNRVNNSIKYGYIKKNKIVMSIFENLKKKKAIKIHIIGLFSNGRIHSDENHIFDILKMLKKVSNKIIIHLFTDGRDCGIRSAYFSIK